MNEKRFLYEVNKLLRLLHKELLLAGFKVKGCPLSHFRGFVLSLALMG